MFRYKFARPSVTATIPLFYTKDDAIFTIVGRRRKDKSESAYPGFLAIPGGFLDAKITAEDIIEDEVNLEEIKYYVRDGETVKQTAIRETFEETNIVITEDDLVLYAEHSDPKTDPRAHVVNLCYYVLLTEAQVAQAKAGDDLETLEHVQIIEHYDNVLFDTDPLAFNHRELLVAAAEKLVLDQMVKHWLENGNKG